MTKYSNPTQKKKSLIFHPISRLYSAHLDVGVSSNHGHQQVDNTMEIFESIHPSADGWIQLAWRNVDDRGEIESVQPVGLKEYVCIMIYVSSSNLSKPDVLLVWSWMVFSDVQLCQFNKWGWGPLGFRSKSKYISLTNWSFKSSSLTFFHYARWKLHQAAMLRLQKLSTPFFSTISTYEGSCNGMSRCYMGPRKTQEVPIT